MNSLVSYFQDFLCLFFPEVCAACGNDLVKTERRICTGCIYDLPYTNFHTDPENKVVTQLIGRFPFLQAGAFLHFAKGGKVQNLIHELKYNNNPETGFRLGELYGIALVDHQEWIRPDLIIPVPLHRRKLKRRGYNQSELIASGFSSAVNIPVNNNILCRNTDTATQTHKSRYNRYENMKNAFAVKDRKALVNKHVLLIDDVVTTGATFEACALAMQDIEGVRLSLGAIAFAE